jgi:hypothetical protein
MEESVRIVALEVEKSKTTPNDYQLLLAEEARKVWELYQKQFIREMYFRADHTSAVLILECGGIEEAKQRLSELPLVSAGLIDFDLVPLVPYPGFSRLFAG